MKLPNFINLKIKYNFQKYCLHLLGVDAITCSNNIREEINVQRLAIQIYRRGKNSKNLHQSAYLISFSAMLRKYQRKKNLSKQWLGPWDHVLTGTHNLVENFKLVKTACQRVTSEDFKLRGCLSAILELHLQQTYKFNNFFS